MRIWNWGRIAGAALMLFALTGCISFVNSERGLQYGPLDAAVANVQKLFVVSSRVRDENGDPVGALEADRSTVLSYFKYDISVPQRAKPGAVQWASAAQLNPAKDFYAHDRKRFANSAQMVNAAIAGRQTRGPSRVLVFVPGFNSNEAATLYRSAQVDRDFPSPDIKVVYDWPSAGQPLLYLHDADSITFARDGLTKLLNDLANSRISEISIMGYSAGAPLVMEALRQLRLTGQNALFRKLEGVILLSPDIDLDVFKADLRRIGRLQNKMFVFSGSDDAIQKLFAPVWGDKQRLGFVHDYTALEDFDVTFIDPGASGDNGESNHLAVVGSPTYIDVVRRMSGSDLIRFAKDAAAGKVPGSQIVRHGRTSRVILPKSVPLLK